MKIIRVPEVGAGLQALFLMPTVKSQLIRTTAALVLHPRGQQLAMRLGILGKAVGAQNATLPSKRSGKACHPMVATEVAAVGLKMAGWKVVGLATAGPKAIQIENVGTLSATTLGAVMLAAMMLGVVALTAETALLGPRLSKMRLKGALVAETTLLGPRFPKMRLQGALLVETALPGPRLPKISLRGIR